MASTQQSPEARELSLVGKVELRIALANTDTQLQDLLNTYLAPLLLKLASEHRAVRDKVITICHHIKSRIQPPSIKLPVSALLKQFKEHSHKPLVRQFDLQYIQQGLSRLSRSEQVDLLPDLIHGIARTSTSSLEHASQIFFLLLRVMTQYDLPPRESNQDRELQSQLQVAEEDVDFLRRRFGDLILFNPTPTKSVPGLTADEYKFLDSEERPQTWDQKSGGGLNLAETKYMICQWLTSDIFTHDQRLVPALFASADANPRVSELGDDLLKRTLPNINLEDEALINVLFGFYFGGPVTSPARAPLRIKILTLISKSLLSTTFADKIVQLVEDGLLSEQVERIMVRGRETTKMRTAIFNYINFVARQGTGSSTRAVAHKLVYALKDFIETQGWPVANPGEDCALRGLGYEIIGLFLKAGPPELLQEENLELLRWLFRSLREDNSGNSTSVSLEETLSTLMGAFSHVEDRDVEDSLRQFLLEQMNDLDQSDNAAARLGKPSFSRSTRYITVRFANRCLPYHDVVARWVDVLALEHGSQERHEVIEEAKKGLDPYWHLMNQSWDERSNRSGDVNQPQELRFPDFSSTASFFLGLVDHQNLPAADCYQESPGSAAALQGRQPAACSAAVRFCRQMLVVEAMTASEEPNISINADWERKVDLTVATSGAARLAILKALRVAEESESKNHHPVLELLKASSQCFQKFEGSSPGFADCRRQCGEIFIELCSLSSNAFLSPIISVALNLERQIEANDPQTRALAAQAFGILATHERSHWSRVFDVLHGLQKTCQISSTAVGAQVNKIHGALLALGFFFSRLSFRRGEAHEENWFQQNFDQFLKVLFAIVQKSKDALLLDATFTALDQVALFHAITPEMISKYVSLEELVLKVANTAKSGNEKAIACLAHLAMVIEGKDESEKAYVKSIEESLHDLHEIKQTESQFAVGEALSCLACGWDSKALATKIDVEASVPEISKRYQSALPQIIDRTLEDCRQTKPSLKKAAVIWLLCLIQYCGHRTEVQERLPACQGAFKRCLSDRDTLVQESASRGLGLVYEHGDRQLKDDLVRDLVGSFSSDKAQTSGTVTEDTQLFEAGALPTGDGNSITTYKDIMNLAAEVGDSSLVYRFMSLASNNAIWSTRAAFGRFGLSNVLSDSSVDGYLAENPKLFPKLFRYRFDPNTNVQRSMNDIWHALVKNPTATIDHHFDAMMEDLLQSILGREWRARQASCDAIADLIQARPAEKYEKYLGRVWTLCFKVMDDIKDSVRVAAAGLARTLTGILTRGLESSASSDKTVATLKDVLPFLLSTQGLESSAEDIRIFALHALLEIIKRASAPTLRPFIPELVEKILGLLSTMEPEAVNYVHMNAQRYNLTEQRIDDMRLASVRASPLMEAVERCLDLLDDATMKALVPKIESAMKTAVGMPSKAGCSRILVSLSTRHSFVFRPHSDHFLNLVQKLIMDRNETVSLSYAASGGYVARGASDKAVIQLATFLKQKLYFGSGDDRSRLIAGELVQAVAKHASDRFNSFASEFVPFVFFAKHDSNDAIKDVFREIWGEHVGGSRTVSLQLQEILGLAAEHLGSSRWVLKHAASRTIADVVDAITGNVGQSMSTSEAETLWEPLCTALSGKTWEGKEVVLEAFATFVQKGPGEFLSKNNVADEVKKIAMREAKRQNEAYRPHAYAALGRVAAARKDQDFAVVDIIGSVIDQLTNPDEDAMDIDSGKGSQKDTLRDLTLENAIEALAPGVNLQGEGAYEFLDIVGKTENLKPVPTTISSAVFTASRDLLKRSLTEKVKLGFQAIARFADTLFEPVDGPEQLRKVRAGAILELSKVEMEADAKSEMMEKVTKEIEKEVSPAVKQELEQARLNL
ncbi:MAG: hypothetical protein Q9157_001753 [Trypethelium eluteriae]